MIRLPPRSTLPAHSFPTRRSSDLFPQYTYELTYSAPGDPALAKKLVQRIVDESMDARVDGQRGFDHGMFIPLKLMFPGADVPVIQLSLRRDLDPGAHLDRKSTRLNSSH